MLVYDIKFVSKYKTFDCSKYFELVLLVLPLEHGWV